MLCNLIKNDKGQVTGMSIEGAAEPSAAFDTLLASRDPVTAYSNYTQLKTPSFDTWYEGSPRNNQGEPIIHAENPLSLYVTNAEGSEKRLSQPVDSSKIDMELEYVKSAHNEYLTEYNPLSTKVQGYTPPTYVGRMGVSDLSKEIYHKHSANKNLENTRLGLMLVTHNLPTILPVKIYSNKTDNSRLLHVNENFSVFGWVAHDRTSYNIAGMSLFANPLSNNNSEAERGAKTFLHECVHIMMYKAYRDDSKLKKEIDALYAQALAANKDKKYFYGLSNADEFLAEAFSNFEFQKYLASIEDKNGKREIKNTHKSESIWNSLMNVLRNLLSNIFDSLDAETKALMKDKNTVLENTLKIIVEVSAQKRYELVTNAEYTAMESAGYLYSKDFANLDDSEMNKPQTELDKSLDRIKQGTQVEVNRKRKINSLADKKQDMLSSTLKKDADSGKYINDASGETFNSITHHEQGMLSEFDPDKAIQIKAGKRRANSYEEGVLQMAENKWKEKDEEFKFDFGSDGILNKKEFIIKKLKTYNSGKEKGSIIMKHIESYFTASEVRKKELDKEILQLFNDPNSEWFRRNKHFDWVKKVVKDLPSRWNVGGEDRIETEREITSPTLNLSGRADIVITRENGLLVIRDIKTNNGLNDVFSNAFMLYGNQPNKQIMNTELNKSKFQVVLYAFMRMVENPGTQFESLGVDWLPFESYATDETISDITLTRTEIEAFLGMIRDYYKDNKEDTKKKAIWDKINEGVRSDLFDSRNYSQVMEYTNKGKDLKSKKPDGAYSTQQEEFQARLQRLKENTLFGNLKDYQKLTFNSDINPIIRGKFSTIKEDVERLTEMISGGEIKGAALSNFADDLTTMNYYLGTIANTGNPVVEVFHKLFESRMTAYRKQIMDDTQNFKTLQLPVINQQRKLKGLPPLKHENDFKKYISSASAIDLYGHLYKEYYDSEGNLKRGLYRTQEDMNNANLTEADKHLLNFLNAHYDSFFVNKGGHIALMNRAVTYTIDNYGDEQYLSALDIYNGKNFLKKGKDRNNWNYDDQTFTSDEKKAQRSRDIGWVPKVAPTEDELLNMYGLTEVSYDENGIPKITKSFKDYTLNELRQTKGFSKFTSAAYWKMWYKTRLTDFWDNEYKEQGEDEDGGIIPRGLGGKIVSQNLSYSLDIEAQFMTFTSQMRKKEQLDDVYAVGKGLSFYLDEYNTPLGKSMQTYLSDFINAHVRDKIQELPNRKGEFGFWSKITQFRSINIDPNRKDGKYTYYNLSARKLLRYIKRGATGAIMFLSPVSSFINMMQALTSSVRKGLAQTAAERFHLIGTDKLKSVNDFSAGDYVSSLRIATKTITSSLWGGDINDDKAWLLAKQMGFLPDNMEYQNSHSLFSGTWKAANPSHGYLLQGIPEEINSLAIMIAQLKSQKIVSSNAKYNGKSLWDIYEVKEQDRRLVDGSIIKVKVAGVPADFTRGTEKQADGSVKIISEITPFEITKMKRVYERIQGGYRHEERTILETTLLGELFLQFRKFVPSLLRDQFGSQKADYSLGYYDNKKVINGEGTEEEQLEWKKRVIEGRFRVLGRMLLGTIFLGRGGFMFPTNVKSGLQASSTLQNRWRWSDMSADQQLMVIDTLTILALWAGPALIVFNTKKSDDDDDSYLKLLQRISNDIVQPLSVINSFQLVTNPLPVGFKVFGKRMSAYTQLAFDALLYTIGQGEDAYTQKGDLKGLKDALRYTPGITSSAYKGYDFVTHKKNDFADILFGSGLR